MVQIDCINDKIKETALCDRHSGKVEALISTIPETALGKIVRTLVDKPVNSISTTAIEIAKGARNTHLAGNRTLPADDYKLPRFGMHDDRLGRPSKRSKHGLGLTRRID